MNFSTFNVSLVVSSITPFYPYTTSKEEGGKYPKDASKGDLLVEMWIALLQGC